MSELRRDLTTDRWVIIAPERGRRPRDAPPQSRPAARALPFDPACPFCPGNESQLPGIIAELPLAQNPGWRTRVVPNKFPAVSHDVAHRKHGETFYETAAGQGYHEVVIESPRHDHDLTTMSEREVCDVLATCRRRYEALTTGEAAQSVIVFRNRGTVAGASLRHPHTQLIALDFVPPFVRAREATMLRYYQSSAHCAVCDIIEHERSDGSRIVSENDAFVTVVPFAANTRCEMWILPKRHEADFGNPQFGEIELLALALCDALARLAAALDDPPYNYVIDTATKGGALRPHLHWALRIVPQLGFPAGFELGSGLLINSSLPEEDATILRSL
jgi:UDPglucose--hexose-1-phosphate uridylyltransferase